MLVLLDLSEDSEQVYAAARDLAAYSNAAIVALHVVEFVPVEPMGESLMPTQIESRPSLIERARAAVGRSWRSVTVRRAPAPGGGRQHQGARSCAWPKRRSADLIVLGSRERHGLAILVNFTEDTVLHAAHCDVLAVRLT